MRIAQIVEQLEIGGLQRMAVDLAFAQKSAGHVPIIYCIASEGPLAKTAAESGVEIRCFHKAPGFSLKAILRIAHQLWKDRIDVVHTHNSVIHHYGAAAAALNRVPVVNTQHGLGMAAMPPRQMRNFRASFPLTDAVVFVAEEPKQILWNANNFPPAKAHVILNGIPVRNFAAHPAQPGARRPRLRFGTVGRIVPVKDHATLMCAFARIAGTFPESELHILGYGVLEEATRTLAESLGVGSRFYIHPPSVSVPEFLASLDVFVLSSRTEGLPVSLLEAMAAGLPVVSTRVGGISEAAPENEVSWFCPPGNIEALADALQAAAQSDQLAERGRRASKIVAERFGIEHTANQYLSLFHSFR
jgi:glycosyltransferase involved in cell wall biosynthesis